MFRLSCFRQNGLNIPLFCLIYLKINIYYEQEICHIILFSVMGLVGMAICVYEELT